MKWSEVKWVECCMPWCVGGTGGTGAACVYTDCETARCPACSEDSFSRSTTSCYDGPGHALRLSLQTPCGPPSLNIEKAGISLWLGWVGADCWYSQALRTSSSSSITRPGPPRAPRWGLTGWRRQRAKGSMFAVCEAGTSSRRMRWPASSPTTPTSTGDPGVRSVKYYNSHLPPSLPL